MACIKQISPKQNATSFLIIIIPCTLPMVPVDEVTVGKGVELAIELADEREGEKLAGIDGV